MQNTTAFVELLDAADRLSSDEQETLVEILQRRMAEHRREELAKEIQDAEQEYQAGRCRPVTPEELMGAGAFVKRPLLRSKPSILIVGGGLAGMAAAMKLAELDCQVGIMSLLPLKRSHSAAPRAESIASTI